IRPVLGSRLNQSSLRKELGGGVFVTPNQVRLLVRELTVETLDAAKQVVSAVEDSGATVLDAAS
ncbi:MAG: hypothetical protein EA415_04060, partial [Sphaerobacteraceae bacterium]